MDLELLKRLSQADAIAANEQEVRDIILDHARRRQKTVLFDGLGSVAIRLNESAGPKVMICAHMDEVGFMVRNISNEGAVEVIPIGNVRMLARFMQPVRITTAGGAKVGGLLDGDLQGAEAQNLRVDIGAASAREAAAAGVAIGDMVTFATPFQRLPTAGRVMGKAFDDRLGCWLLLALLDALERQPLDAEIWLAASSSEEVGLRGGQTAARMIKPDLALVLDTACWAKNFDFGAANHRQIGAGPLLVMYDKTLVPPRRLLRWIQDTALRCAIPLQTDMFSNGGTDGGGIHLSDAGVPTAAIGVPTRHGHCAASIADLGDAERCLALLTALVTGLNAETYRRLTDFSC